MVYLIVQQYCAVVVGKRLLFMIVQLMVDVTAPHTSFAKTVPLRTAAVHYPATPARTNNLSIAFEVASVSKMPSRSVSYGARLQCG
jgi:hypothetical protein